MGAAIPSCGYPSRTAAVEAMIAEGLSIRDIAARLGISTKNVHNLTYSAQRFPKRQQRPAERNGRTVLVPLDILDRLQPFAEERGVSVNMLVRDILDTVGSEDLVRAVLDDD